MIAAQVGTMRRVSSKQKGKGVNDGYEDDGERKGWDRDIEGAAAELVVADYLGVYWPASVNADKADPDVGDRIQVRSSHRPDAQLIVRPGDRLDHIYVLVTGRIPDLRLIGWVQGEKCKQDSAWFTNNGREDLPKAWFVPRTALIDMAYLNLELCAAPPK
jgi:hypothetical protein